MNNENIGLSPQDKEKHKENIENYKALKSSRRSILESALSGIVVAMVVLFTQALNETLKGIFPNLGNSVYLIDIIILVLPFWYFFNLLKKEHKNIFKPVISAPNFVATIKDNPIDVKGQDGADYKIILFEDPVYKKVDAEYEK